MSEWKGVIARSFSKEEFQNYVDGIPLINWRPQFAVLHNTAIPRFDQWHDAPGARRMAGLAAYYRDEQKWSGGPHLFVADDYIWVFTPLTVPGVHAPSWNAISWGVEMVGDYDHEELPPALFDNTISALATLCRKIRQPAETIRLHKEDPLTTHRSCPGVRVKKAEVISRVKALLDPPDFSDVTGGGSSTAPND